MHSRQRDGIHRETVSASIAGFHVRCSRPANFGSTLSAKTVA